MKKRKNKYKWHKKTRKQTRKQIKKQVKSKKILLYLFLILFLSISVFLIYYYFKNQQDFLNISLGGSPIDVEGNVACLGNRTFAYTNWNNINIDIFSSYIGDVYAGQKHPCVSESVPNDAYSFEICGSRSGVSISNEYNNFNNFYLMSKINGDSCRNFNYISSNFTIPKGQLNGNCNIVTQIGSTSGGESRATCKIIANTGDILYEFSRFSGTSGVDRPAKNETNNFSLNFASPMQISIWLEDKIGDENSVGMASITFNLNNATTTQTNLTTYYRFYNNTCSSISLNVNDKTASDYSTLADCNTHIIILINNSNNQSNITQQNQTQINQTTNNNSITSTSQNKTTCWIINNSTNNCDILNNTTLCEKNIKHYYNESDCKDTLIKKKGFINILTISISVFIIILITISIILFNIKNKRKRKN